MVNNMKYYLEVADKDTYLRKSSWGGILDLKDARNRAYGLISQYKKEGKTVKVVIYQMTDPYKPDSGIIIETIESNPYEK